MQTTGPANSAPTSRQAGPNELRDHLANERTFLAWVRTAITIVALGFVVAKFGILLREVGGGHVHASTARAGAAVGVTLVLSGMLTVVMAVLKFMQIRRDIERQVVAFTPTLDIALAVMMVLAGVVLTIYLVWTS